MDCLLEELAESLPKIVIDKEFRTRVERAVEEFESQEREMIESFDREVREAGFSMVQIQTGPITRPEVMPVVEDKPVAIDELQALLDEGKIDEEKLAAFKEGHKTLTEKLRDVFDGVGRFAPSGTGGDRPGSPAVAPFDL